MAPEFVAAVPELAAADSAILLIGHDLDQNRCILICQVKFTSDMNAEGIRHIIRAAVRTTRAMIGNFEKAIGIAFVPDFSSSWPDEADLLKSEPARVLAKLVLRQGWEALDALPCLGNVKSLCNLIVDRTINRGVRNRLMRGANYLPEIHKQASFGNLDPKVFLCRPELEDAYKWFHELYPEFGLLYPEQVALTALARSSAAFA